MEKVIVVKRVKELKITEEMRNNPNFNFAVYVYENTNADSVNEDSLQFLDEKRNPINSIDNAVYFTMSVEIENIIRTKRCKYW